MDRIRRRRAVSKSRRLVALARLGFFGVIAGFFILLIALPFLAFGLPSPDKVAAEPKSSTKILDRNGKTLYDIFSKQNRIPVELGDIPLYLRQATVATEDKNFYSHQGFDPLGILRGFSRLFTTGRAEGGSTLTQQLVKNVLLTNSRSVTRKIKELVLALQIEKKYTKDEILLMYLNDVPYGGPAVGVEAASELYFGKKVSELNLSESAFIAGLPQAPSTYSPYSTTPKAYIARTKEVLRRMREDGYITPDQEDAAFAQLDNLEFKPKGSDYKAPHFVAYVQKILEDRYGTSAVETGGLKVTTTLDVDLQDTAQEIVATEIAKVEKQHITNGAAVVLDPQTGEILAMVGSKNFSDPNYDGQVNVTVALRQPGSSFKPFTYVTALKKGYTASTLLMDVPTNFPGGTDQPDYSPVNYDGEFVGPIQVRYALANSRNVPAVKMLAMVGIRDVLSTATDMGITTLPPTKETLSRVGLSLTLGGGEVRLLDMADAYSAFVNEGYRVDPVAILKVEDAKGKVLENNKPKKGKQVLSSAQAYVMESILSDNEARTPTFGPNSYLKVPGVDVMVKTGTTNDKRDNWTIGGNANAMVAVWVGNNDNSPMNNVASGVSGASPIWHSIVLAALKGKPKVSFNAPGDIVTAQVDSVSGFAAHDNFPSRSEIFVKGTTPREDTVHVLLKVCKNDGKLATPGDIAAGNYDSKEYFVFKEEDPTAGLGQPNRWQEAIINWLNGQGDSKYHPPTDYCGTGNPISVDFTSPHDHDQVGNSFTMQISANSTAKVTRVDFYKDNDGSPFRSFDAAPYKEDVNLSDGVHTLKAVATDENGKQSDRTITIGVNVPWNNPSPTATPTPTP